ncbi:MAG: hypothetical protein HZC51_00825 [Nitrospirae bacterium]|nr:hypothetical protein [Nitrospirota bacterium]
MSHMIEYAEKFEDIFETMKGGDTRELATACDLVVRSWKDVPVEPLLALKALFSKVGLEDREAHIDEALASIAEKRPEPFTKIATEPESPLWLSAVEVLSLTGDEEYLDLFVSLLPLCPKRKLPGLVRSIGRYRCAKAAEAVSPYLNSSDEALFFEALLSLEDDGGPEALACLRAARDARRREGSEMAAVLERVVEKMERAAGGPEGPSGFGQGSGGASAG